MARKYSVKFDHEGHKVRCMVTELTETDLADLDGSVGDEARRNNNYRPHIARYLALTKCVEKRRIKVDEKTYTVESGNKAPPVVIDDKDHTTLDHLVGFVMYYNPVLLERERYREVFEDYALDEEEFPYEDPNGYRAVAGVESAVDPFDYQENET